MLKSNLVWGKYLIGEWVEYVENDLGEVGDVGKQRNTFISQTFSSSQFVQLVQNIQLPHIYRHISHILEFSIRFINILYLDFFSIKTLIFS